MTKRTSPPLRAEQVGGILRPPELLAARAAHREGTLDAEGLSSPEGEEIEAVVAIPKERRRELVGDAELLAGYPEPSQRALRKEIDHLDRHVRRFLELSPFAVLATSSADGSPDVSPRGGEPGFLHPLDDETLLLGDRPGNNRLDSLGKLSENPRAALLCMVPGIDETLRIYGSAELRDAGSVPLDLTEKGMAPRSVLVLHVERAFMHCAKALMRSRLWAADAKVERSSFPTMAEVMRDHTSDDGPLESQEEMALRYSPDL